MEKEIKTLTEVKPLNIQAVTTCEATAQMLRKAERDGVETAFDRAEAMKPCPIGADSACCKHCAMGPCRLTIPLTIWESWRFAARPSIPFKSRNFARMVACGTAAHSEPRDVHALIFFGTWSMEKIKITPSRIPTNFNTWC